MDWTCHEKRGKGPSEKTMFSRPEGARRRGRPKTRLLDKAEEDLQKIGIRAWRRRALDRNAWRDVIEKAKAHQGL